MLTRIHKAMEHKDEGFTLIELLVVIIIIGILAAIAIPVFLNQRKKAVEASLKSDAHTVANEEETYYTDAQNYVAVTNATGTFTLGSDSVTLSSGNTANVELISSGSGYCITMSNPNASPQDVYYNSLNGGLTTTPCP